MKYLLTLLTLVALGVALPKPDSYSAIQHATRGFGISLDTRNYNDLSKYTTKDFVFDSSALGNYGFVTQGLDKFIEVVKAGTGSSLTSSNTSPVFIEFKSNKQATVITYYTFSSWDKQALRDITKTFRLYLKCNEDYIVDTDGQWKTQKTIVEFAGPGAEAPYFGN